MRKLDPTRALVLFSGGQDSSISLAWALDRYAHVETIGFHYGQRHAVELGARLAVRKDQRNRGLAQALLVDAYGRSRDHGVMTGGLSTDSRTGALGLYEKVGMRVIMDWVNRAKTL